LSSPVFWDCKDIYSLLAFQIYFCCFLIFIQVSLIFNFLMFLGGLSYCLVFTFFI